MTKLIISAIIAVVGAVLWFWKRYGSVAVKIARLEKQIGEILNEQQDALENNDMVLFNALDAERLQLCEAICNLRR